MKVRITSRFKLLQLLALLGHLRFDRHDGAFYVMLKPTSGDDIIRAPLFSPILTDNPIRVGKFEWETLIFLSRNYGRMF